VTFDVAGADSSALIIFWQIRRLELLRSMFRQAVVPRAVAREVFPSLGPLPAWLVEQHAPLPPRPALVLDDGEREAIALALDLDADVVVLDDLPGRRVALTLGLQVIGSAGLLLQAKGAGLIDAVRPDLDAMLEAGFYVSRPLYRDVLMAAGERER
jgi:predicted nucleic acid-binding protein